jgi:site-specific recombinase XerD
MSRRTIYNRFQQACGALGEDRLDTLTVHHGRHSFISHALAGGRTLAEVRNAAGHSSIATTSIYTHVAVEDDDVAGSLFEFATAEK